jgi:hypothetical protein
MGRKQRRLETKRKFLRPKTETCGNEKKTGETRRRLKMTSFGRGKNAGPFIEESDRGNRSTCSRTKSCLRFGQNKSFAALLEKPWSQSYDRELQRRRCQKLQRRE